MSIKKKEKQSSWLLNLFMLIVGAISIMLAVVGLLSSYITMPDWWPFKGIATLMFMALVGSVPVGVWMFIGALGLWKEKAWLWAWRSCASRLSCGTGSTA